MSGAMATGAGLDIMGGTLGGIGDIMQAAKYQRPTLPQPGGQESRLRALAQSQLIGGGQELLGGTALYNQMAPILMSQLPGMHYVPGSSSLGGVGDTSTGGGSAGGSSPGQSYSDALGNYQQQQALQRQMTALKAQIKATKPGGGVLKGLKHQKEALRRQINSLPTAAQLQRQQYEAGTQPDASLYNLSMGGGGGSGTGGMGAPDNTQSLATIRSLMASLGGSGGPQSTQPDFLTQYYNAGGVPGLGGS